MKLFLTGILGAAAMWLILGITSGSSPTSSTYQSTYERVLSSGKLRCGYILWPLTVEKDPNTGSFKGAYFDFVEKVASEMGLTVEWTQEVPFADMFEALNSQRVDAICAGIWPSEKRALHGEFTLPIAYQSVQAYARADDHRFDSDLNLINNPEIKIATIDGEMSQTIRARSAPKSTEYSMPKDTDGAQLLLSVSSGKADLTFTERGSAETYLRSNPDSIRMVSKEPLSAHGVTMVLRKGEMELKTAMDIATQALLLNGEVDKILNRYDPERRYFERVKRPF